MIILPEIFLSLSVLALLLVGPFIRKKGYVIIGYLVLLVLIISQFFIFKNIFQFEPIFNGFFVIDSFGSFMKCLLLIGTTVVIYMYLTVNKDN